MPTIHVDAEVCQAHMAYASLWQPTGGERVATLVRLDRQPLHTVASDRDVDDHDGRAGQVRS